MDEETIDRAKKEITDILKRIDEEDELYCMGRLILWGRVERHLHNCVERIKNPK